MDSIIIGEVLKPQGIQGELKVYPITDDPTRFKQLKKVLISDGKTTESLSIKAVRVDPKGLVFLTVEGINTREEAEKYRGFTIRVKLADVPPLKDRWYYFELEGMKVYENDVLLGTLTKVLATGANDVYIVKDNDREILVPALKTVVKNVDVPKKRMDVVLPPGLLD
ncbi:MAG: 16S rRNA processing protein RimM [Gracilibacter sp. BRH_c7a]|nr:MAG: 16S rRNA processing protein RimM [Gracilibacter sp. BRH_c7a]